MTVIKMCTFISENDDPFYFMVKPHAVFRVKWSKNLKIQRAQI